MSAGPTRFYNVMKSFVATGLLRLVIPVSFPHIALWPPGKMG